MFEGFLATGGLEFYFPILPDVLLLDPGDVGGWQRGILLGMVVAGEHASFHRGFDLRAAAVADGVLEEGPVRLLQAVFSAPGADPEEGISARAADEVQSVVVIGRHEIVR